MIEETFEQQLAQFDHIVCEERKRRHMQIIQWMTALVLIGAAIWLFCNLPCRGSDVEVDTIMTESL